MPRGRLYYDISRCATDRSSRFQELGSVLASAPVGAVLQNRLAAAVARAVLTREFIDARLGYTGVRYGHRRRELLQRSRDRLREAGERRGVGKIRVFGSVARGEETPGGDVDLLVELAPDRTLIDLIGFQQDAEEILGGQVDAFAPRFIKRRLLGRAFRDARPI